MGQIKTTKLDNGMVGFECVYGGLEAPFGGIDASKAPRYIDPRCFADASNFLIVDNELCLCYLNNNAFPPLTGVTYPLAANATVPGLLLGMGKLPCDGVVKNWALFVAPAIDTNGYWNYRLIIYEDGTGWVEHNFAVPQLNIPIAGQNAQATILVSYKSPFTVNQTVPEFTLHPGAGGTQAPPYAYGGVLYEVCQWNYTVNGTPSSGTPYTTLLFGNSYNPGGGAGFIQCNTPASGPPTCIPTPAALAGAIANMINTTATYPFTAAVDGGNPNLIHLTARTLGGYGSVDGSLGNALNISGGVTVQEFGYYPLTTGLSFILCNPAVPPQHFQDANPFTQPSFAISISPFTGGTDGSTYAQQPIKNLTWETVGDTLYLAGWPANYMLQYSNKTKQFSFLTQYEGARVLKKMAGHLISVGAIWGIDHSQNLVSFDNPHLWFSWSAPEGNYSQWESLDPTGLVTGAGGEQIGDISDMLTGLVVSNSVAFILRAEGLSYASVLQGASIPFDINHVALAKEGQGCPSTNLWTQFDQLGFYVGTSNIFILQQSPQAVGDNILEVLYPQLIALSNRLSEAPLPGYPFTIIGNPPPMDDAYYNKVNVEAMSVPINQKVDTSFYINLEGIVYVYSPINGTWMKLNLGPIFPGESSTAPVTRWSILKCASLAWNETMGHDGSYQTKQSVFYGQQNVGGNYQVPLLYYLNPVQTGILQQKAHVWFSQEEISLGRDITIDALYVLMCGVSGMTVNFSIDGYQINPDTGASEFVQGAFNSTIIFGAAARPGNYEEYQVFDVNGIAVTLKAPQVHVDVPSQGIAYTPLIPWPIVSEPIFKIAKLAMFGSFDPNQRPV